MIKCQFLPYGDPKPISHFKLPLQVIHSFINKYLSCAYHVCLLYGLVPGETAMNKIGKISFFPGAYILLGGGGHKQINVLFFQMVINRYKKCKEAE